MKEATGELNMTVITVVAIAAVAAFFYAFVWPSIQASLILTTACNSVGGNGDYTGENVTCSDYVCTYTKSNGSEVTKTCDSRTNGQS